jgi:hypothetical protein
MGMNDYNPDFDCTPAQYHGSLSKLWIALGNSNPTGEDVFTLAARAIEEAQQRPSRREIAAMAMQGLLACPSYIQTVEVLASTSIRAADALIERLNADPAEGVDLLPMYSRGLDEELTDGR